MDNIIHVDFTRKLEPALEGYLNSLREQGIDEDDVMDVLDAINDVEVYSTADDDIRLLASGWFAPAL